MLSEFCQLLFSIIRIYRVCRTTPLLLHVEPIVFISALRHAGRKSRDFPSVQDRSSPTSLQRVSTSPHSQGKTSP